MWQAADAGQGCLMLMGLLAEGCTGNRVMCAVARSQLPGDIHLLRCSYIRQKLTKPQTQQEFDHRAGWRPRHGST
jgi:hypothetical protein